MGHTPILNTVGLPLQVGRFVETQLYSVQPLDAFSFAATAGVMIATAFVASLVPAFRALRIDPISALRGE